MDFRRPWDIFQKFIVYLALIIVSLASIFPDLLNAVIRFIPFINNDIEFFRIIVPFFAIALFSLYLDFNWYIKDAREFFNTMDNHLSGIDFIECADLDYGVILAIAYALEKDKKIDSIDIFARTTKTYYGIISKLLGNEFSSVKYGQTLQEKLGFTELTKLQFTKVDKLRILVTENQILQKQNLGEYENRWDKLEGTNGVLFKNVNIKTCNLFSANHYAIINDKYIVDGSYKYILPNCKNDPEENLLETFIYLNRDIRDSMILKTRKKHFDLNFFEANNGKSC